MIYFLSCVIRLLDVNKLSIESDTYLLEVLTKFSVEYFIKTFDMMLQQERIKHLGSRVSMGVGLLSILVKIKSITKLANTSYISLCKSGTFNFPTASFSPCFNVIHLTMELVVFLIGKIIRRLHKTRRISLR